MKKSPASIERNATASAEQSTSENGNAAENIFHSKPTATENQKERNTMKLKTKIDALQKLIATEVVKEIRDRLHFLVNVFGLSCHQPQL